MKSIVSVMTAFLSTRRRRTNFFILLRVLALFVLLVVLYSTLFHVIMEREGQSHTWWAGFYWTMVTMSTLGFGDIVFASGLGQIFSVVVLGSGVMFLLVLLPFTFIEFFYAPWMEAQAAVRSPRELPEGSEKHVIFTERNPVHDILRRMLEDHGYRCHALVATSQEAQELFEVGLSPVVGDANDPATWRALRVGSAALVVTTRSDVGNTNITFTIREVCEKVPIVSSAQSDAARDALELAGVTHILRLEEMMGEALARRVNASEDAAHVIGSMGHLLVAEAPVDGTNLAGSTLKESGLRVRTGVTVVGLWRRGALQPVEADTELTPHCMLVLAGTEEQIAAYNRLMETREKPSRKVVIVGCGVVGLSTAKALAEQGVDYTIIERSNLRQVDPEHTIKGDAANFDMLVKAGLHEAASVIITTHDDEMNLFLTIFYRRLRRSLQVITRCARPEYVDKLHRAGADLVLSYSSMAANTIFNFLRGSDNLLLAEGVNVFSFPVPDSLVGDTLAESNVRSRSGCSIIALEAEGESQVNPSADTVLEPGAVMVLIGSLEAEEKFLEVFRPGEVPLRAERAEEP